MKIYTNQLTDDMISRMELLIGQTFKKYVARKSQYSDKSEIPLETGLFFTNDCFILKNDYIECDFVKSDEVDEEYNIFTIENMENNEYVSHSKDVALFDFPVKEKIVDIKITTDTIHCFNKEFDEEFITDVAITFCLETCNMTFYRSAWFSPYIDIEKTNVDTISEMPNMSDSTEAFSSSMHETNIKRTVKSVDKSQGLLV